MKKATLSLIAASVLGEQALAKSEPVRYKGSFEKDLPNLNKDGKISLKIKRGLNGASKAKQFPTSELLPDGKHRFLSKTRYFSC